MSAPAILIADDDDGLRRLMQRVLETGGFRVLAASDGEQALATLAAAPNEIAVVVLDLLMPPHRGHETLSRLLTIQPDVGIVLTSGLPPENDVSALVAKRRAVFLQKPFAPHALRRSVEDLLVRSND